MTILPKKNLQSGTEVECWASHGHTVQVLGQKEVLERLGMPHGWKQKHELSEAKSSCSL